MLTQPVLPDHITHASGRRKTCCTATVLAALGIEPGQYRYCSTERDLLRILRAHGFSARSRTSTLGRRVSVHGMRERVKGVGETRVGYMVIVAGHVILLGWQGRTLVDTAPVSGPDLRKVQRVYRIARK